MRLFQRKPKRQGANHRNRRNAPKLGNSANAGSVSFNRLEQKRVLKERNPITTPNIGFSHLINELSILNEINDFLLNVASVGRALTRVTDLGFTLQDLATQRFRNTQSEYKRIGLVHARKKEMRIDVARTAVEDPR